MSINVGDKVRVILPGERRHNQLGIVRTEPTDTGRFIVEFPDGDGWWVYDDQVEKIE